MGNRSPSPQFLPITLAVLSLSPLNCHEGCTQYVHVLYFSLDLEVPLANTMTAELIEDTSWSNSSEDPEFGEESPITGVLGAVLLLMCLIGVTGNLYTLVVALGGMALRSTGSLCVYVVNLALADLLYLSTIPFVVCTYFAQNWFFGDVGCRLLLSLDLLTMHASIFLLTAMSLERYWAVTRPLKARRAGNSYRKFVSVATWILSWLLTVPMMVMIQQREGSNHKHICFPTWTPEAFRVYLTILFSTSILGPGLVLGIVYSRLAQAYWASMRAVQPCVTSRVLKQQLFSRIFGIIVAYWACFVPFWAWQLAKLYWSEGLAMGPTTQAYLNFGVTCLTYSNSCINPFLYTLLTRNYREYVAAQAGERRGGEHALFRRRKHQAERRSVAQGERTG
ncbi:urotensin-2 receptor-like [Varanus komodoensis]|uniref:urotensin-2 receptor-like n=1 Tax=Varanus komodoensis TaxID=61221 RepID=UPI001CF777E9|nr:urotensin-2 receptor-like [Varanus komodoensis]